MSEKIRGRVERGLDRAEDIYRSHGRIFRTMWIAVGVIVVLAGLAMIVFPGPVTIVVPAGLVMLAVVFGWARRLLMLSVDKGVEAKHRADQASTKVKVLGAVASVCLAAAALAAFLLW